MPRFNSNLIWQRRSSSYWSDNSVYTKRRKSKMLVFGQAVFLVPSPTPFGSVSSRCSGMSPRGERGLIPEQRLDTEPTTPFLPIFLLLLNLFNMAPEIKFTSSNFPPSHKTASYAGWNLKFHFFCNHSHRDLLTSFSAIATECILRRQTVFGIRTQ